MGGGAGATSATDYRAAQRGAEFRRLSYIYFLKINASYLPYVKNGLLQVPLQLSHKVVDGADELDNIVVWGRQLPVLQGLFREGENQQL